MFLGIVACGSGDSSADELGECTDLSEPTLGRHILCLWILRRFIRHCLLFRFAEIVPAEHRNLVYAFDRCFEGAVAAFAAPLVGVLAEKWFGFTGSSAVTGDRDRDLANARALGSALLFFLAVPWTACLIVYTGELEGRGTGWCTAVVLLCCWHLVAPSDSWRFFVSVRACTSMSCTVVAVGCGDEFGLLSSCICDVSFCFQYV